MKYYIIYPKNVVEFENYHQLVNYIIGKKEEIFRRVKICKDDTHYTSIRVKERYHESSKIWLPYYEYKYVSRDVEVIDKFGNNAFTHELISDVNKYEYREDIAKEHQKYTRRNQKQKYSRWSRPLVEFRKEPVPYTGGHGGYYWLRHPKTFQEIKMSCDPEYKDFVRKSRGKNLPTVYDDLIRESNLDISWKRCTKNRHQWENRIKCKNKGVYVYQEKKIEEVINSEDY